MPIPHSPLSTPTLVQLGINMVNSSLRLFTNTAIKSFKYKLPTKFECVTIETAIAQLESEIGALEKYAQKSQVQKQQQQQEIFQDKVTQGIQHLESLAHKINTLAMQIETEMLNFKEVAVEINHYYHNLQHLSNSQDLEWNESRLHQTRPLNIWEVHNSSLPIVVKKGTKFILTVKSVNLFPANQTVNAKTKAKLAQKRRNTLEIWLAKQHNLKHN